MAEDVKCPLCGSETAEQTSKKGPNAGQSFHVCNRYPECKGKVEIREDEDVDGFLVGQEEKIEPLTPSVEEPKAEKEVEVKSGKKKRRPLIGCLVVIGVIFIIGVIGAIAGLGDSTPSPTATPIPDEGVTESSVRSDLQDLSGAAVVSADRITDIKVYSNYGTDNPDDFIVHVYFQPEYFWDEEHALKIAVHTSIKAMEILFNNDDISEVVMWELLEFTDKYGETEVETAVRLVMEREVADKIVDWGTVDDRALLDYNTFFDLAELQFIHPAISTNL